LLWLKNKAYFQKSPDLLPIKRYFFPTDYAITVKEFFRLLQKTFMKSFNSSKRIAVIIYLFLFCFSKEVSAQEAAINILRSGSSNNSAEKASAEIVGAYRFSSHRRGRGGFENLLSVEQDRFGKLHVSFEGAYFFRAEGREEFHDASAQGEFLFEGTTANGKFIEKDNGNGCRVQLAFLNQTVTVTSSNCDLTVPPDGTYQRTAAATLINKRVSKNKKHTVHDNTKPFVQLDENENPIAVLNLMSGAEVREGCEDKTLSFTGKLLTIENPNEHVYEFTLAGSSRKRQKFSMVISASDLLSSEDLQAIIKIGANLRVTYLNCGNAPIAAPTAIYKR
jgi:hypothetical protein